jgi:uncharacterized membrane protein YeaQ/YmgE (transglycosylase-associated protein family)
MEIFLDSPWPYIVVGVIVEGALALALYVTRRGVLLYVILGVLLAVIAGVLFQRWVITERKRVMMTIDEGVEALRSNSEARMDELVSPTAEETRRQIHKGLDLVRVTDVSLHNLAITINDRANPPSAEVQFDAVIYFESRSPTPGPDRWAGHLLLHLQRTADRWLILDPVEGSPVHL